MLRSVPFDDPRLCTFLERYYDGRVPVEALAGAPYEVVRCRRCGLGWQRWVLDDAGMEALYSRWISAASSLEKKRTASATLFLQYALEAKVVADLVDRPRGDVEVLDFGMGWGHWCRVAAAFGFRVTGAELSPERRAHARTMGVRVVDDLEASDARFDFVNAEQVFEHVPDPAPTLDLLVRRLRPGGIVRIAVPKGDRDLRRVRRGGWEAGKDALHPLEHVNCFAGRSLDTLGRRAGLEVVRRPYPLDPAFWGLRVRHAAATVRYFRRNA